MRTFDLTLYFALYSKLIYPKNTLFSDAGTHIILGEVRMLHRIKTKGKDLIPVKKEARYNMLPT